MSLLTHKMPHQDAAALCNADTKQEYERNHVEAVGAGCQSLVADLIYKIGDHHLRQAVGDILAHGRHADLQQVAQFLPGHRTEIAQWETWDMHLEMDGGEQHHSHGPARCSSDGGTLYTQLRTPPSSEYQGIVAYDVQHVYDTRHHHGIYHLVGTT